eukprot:3919320-Pleurochrysis_carterae.AAC.1
MNADELRAWRTSATVHQSRQQVRFRMGDSVRDAISCRWPLGANYIHTGANPGVRHSHIDGLQSSHPLPNTAVQMLAHEEQVQ